MPIGCEEEGCPYWIHVRCSGVDLKTKKQMEVHKLYCNKHKKVNET